MCALHDLKCSHVIDSEASDWICTSQPEFDVYIAMASKSDTVLHDSFSKVVSANTHRLTNYSSLAKRWMFIFTGDG